MDQNLQFTLPFRRSAADEDRREVWGWASTESLASDGMIITYEASKAAFERWITRGNIREMHQPIAAGRALAWAADDPSRRIWVGTRVSRGAQSTWEKILDGTLQAFSVKGRIDKMEPRTIQRNGKSVTIPHVLSYTIDEMSYVDAGSDPGADFVNIIRGDGIIADVLDVGAIELADGLDEPNVTMVSRVDGPELNSPLVDPDELARAENVTITPIATDETPTGMERSQVQPADEGVETTTEAGAEVLRADATTVASDGQDAESGRTAEGSLVERIDGEGGLDPAAAEMTQAALAAQILRDINTLIGLEAGELANDESQDVWDVYGLLQARSIVKGFMVQEIVEAVTMARRAEELDTSVTQLQEQLTEAITRLDTLQAAQETVERGESPVLTLIKAQVTELEEKLERYADQPLPTKPLARLPAEKMFAGDEPGTVDSNKVLRALETIAKEGPASTQAEAQALAAKVGIMEVYRQGPTPIPR